MKKILTLFVAFTLSSTFAQKKPKYEKLDNEKTQVTYFDDKGFIKEVGTFKKGKLHGKWLVYNDKKEPVVFANYKEGKKQGKWKFILDDGYYLVTYSDNKIISLGKIVNNQKYKLVYVK